jgi:tetratricopeptide (TPR) repeat protein
MIRKTGWLFIWAFPLLLWGGSEEVSLLLRQGLEAFRRSDWAYAEGCFWLAWERHDRSADVRDADIRFFLGMALYHQGKHEKSLPLLDGAIRWKTRYLPRALYYRAMVYSALNRPEDAKADFRQLLLYHHNSPEARAVWESAGKSLPPEPPSEPASPEETKEIELPVRDWRVVLREALVYDDNVFLDSSASAIHGKADMSIETSLYARYAPARHPGWKGSYAGFLTQYDDQNHLDMVGNVLGGARRWGAAPGGAIETGYRFTHLRLDDDPYLYQHTLHASRETEPVGKHKFSWGGEVALKDYRLAFYDPLDSRVLSARLGYEGPIPQTDRVVTLDGVVGYEDADRNYQSFQWMDLGAGVEEELPWWGLRGEVRPGFRWRTYDKTHPVYGKEREDHLWRLTTGCSKVLGNGLVIQLEVECSENRSNIDPFHYRKKTVLLAFSKSL